MANTALVYAALATMSALTLQATNYPLHFKTLSAQDAMSFPGGYGISGSFSPSKPYELKKEPKAVSRHPLYAHCRLPTGGEAFLARLDESQGDGNGYDQLLVDVNQNGDLTDDTPVPRLAQPQGQEAVPMAQFGPIPAGKDKPIAGGQPVFYAQTYLYGQSTSGSRVSIPSGLLRLKAGWYVETTVEVEGAKHKVGVYDANGNLRLGDPPAPQIQRSKGQDAAWGFSRADLWLVDANGSGAFEEDALQTEAVPFGSLLYLGAKPCKVSLSADCQSLEVEPWAAPLAEVVLGPKAEQIQSLTLAWERQGGQWQLLRPAVVQGKIQVPPGNYRLYGCNLLGKAASGEQTAVSATERVTRMPFSFVAGKPNKLDCGGPLTVKVLATKSTTRSESFGLFSSSSDAKPTLRISTLLLGTEGEVYSAYFTGDQLRERPAKPTFTIADAAGKEVAHGNLEYG